MTVLLLGLVVAVLLGTGTYLVLRRAPVNLLVGLTLLTYGVNLVLFAASGLDGGDAPIVGKDVDPTEFVDPLPQALILTAIVISFAVTAFAVILTDRGARLGLTGVEATSEAGTGSESPEPTEGQDENQGEDQDEDQDHGDEDPGAGPSSVTGRSTPSGDRDLHQEAEEHEDEDYVWLDLEKSGESVLYNLWNPR